VLALALFTVQPLFAQVAIDDLAAPSAPGFVVLGVEPASIARPTSPRAVGLSLLSAVAHGENLVPKNYALEVAPFWLRSRPTLTYKQYDEASIAQTLIQSLSLSVATASFSADGDRPSSVGVSFGLRTMLLKGTHNSETPRLIARLKELQNKILDATSPDEEERLASALRQVALDIQTQNRKRVGWALEMATALAATYPEGNYAKGRVSRLGLWVTPAYELENPRLSLIGVARYLRDREEAQPEADLVDVGLRVQIEWEQLGLSTEAVRRLVSASENDDGSSTRLMGLVDYRISDDLYLSASFGKNYENRLTGKSNLVSFLGVNFGLSRKPLVQIE
jgi:hypothetical protein